MESRLLLSSSQKPSVLSKGDIMSDIITSLNHLNDNKDITPAVISNFSMKVATLISGRPDLYENTLTPYLMRGMLDTIEKIKIKNNDINFIGALNSLADFLKEQLIPYPLPSSLAQVETPKKKGFFGNLFKRNPDYVGGKYRKRSSTKRGKRSSTKGRKRNSTKGRKRATKKRM